MSSSHRLLAISLGYNNHLGICSLLVDRAATTYTVQRQTAVTAYFLSKQLLLFAFVGQACTIKGRHT